MAHGTNDGRRRAAQSKESLALTADRSFALPRAVGRGHLNFKLNWCQCNVMRFCFPVALSRTRSCCRAPSRHAPRAVSRRGPRTIGSALCRGLRRLLRYCHVRGRHHENVQLYFHATSRRRNLVPSPRPSDPVFFVASSSLLSLASKCCARRLGSAT